MSRATRNLTSPIAAVARASESTTAKPRSPQAGASTPASCDPRRSGSTEARELGLRSCARDPQEPDNRLTVEITML